MDAELSPEGWEYAEKLKRFIIDYRSHKGSPESKSADEERSLSVSKFWAMFMWQKKEYSVTNTCSRQVWTSTQKKSRQTASVFSEENVAVRQYSMLNQLNPGEVDGLTLDEIKVLMHFFIQDDMT